MRWRRRCERRRATRRFTSRIVSGPVAGRRGFRKPIGRRRLAGVTAPDDGRPRALRLAARRPRFGGVGVCDTGAPANAAPTPDPEHPGRATRRAPWRRLRVLTAWRDVVCPAVLNRGRPSLRDDRNYPCNYPWSSANLPPPTLDKHVIFVKHFVDKFQCLCPQRAANAPLVDPLGSPQIRLTGPGR